MIGRVTICDHRSQEYDAAAWVFTRLKYETVGSDAVWFRTSNASSKYWGCAATAGGDGVPARAGAMRWRKLASRA